MLAAWQRHVACVVSKLLCACRLAHASRSVGAPSISSQGITVKNCSLATCEAAGHLVPVGRSVNYNDSVTSAALPTASQDDTVVSTLGPVSPMAGLHGSSPRGMSRHSPCVGRAQHHATPGPTAWHAQIRCRCSKQQNFKSSCERRRTSNARAAHAADMAAAALLLYRSHQRCVVASHASNGDQLLPTSIVEGGGPVTGTPAADGIGSAADEGQSSRPADTNKKRSGSKTKRRFKLQPGTAAALAAKWQPLLQARGVASSPADINTQMDEGSRSGDSEPDDWWLDTQPVTLDTAVSAQAPQQDLELTPAAATSPSAGHVPQQQRSQRSASQGVTLPQPDAQQLAFAYPWLLGEASGLSQADMQTRIQYAQLLQQSLSMLVSYDISALEGRRPPLDRNPAVIEPSLYARTQARWEAAQRQEAARLRVAAPANPAAAAAALQVDKVDLTDPGALMTGPVSQDAAWTKRQASQAAYLQYMKQLHSVLVPSGQQADTATVAAQQPSSADTTTKQGGRASKTKKQQQQRQQQQEMAVASTTSSTSSTADTAGQVQQLPGNFPLDPQLSYQVGICEDWLQLSYLLNTFLSHVGSTTVVALYRRVVTLVTPTRMVSWGPSERQAFSLFCAQLAQRAQQLVQNMLPWHVGCVMYGVAVLEGLHDGRPYDSLSVLPPAFSFGMQLAAPASTSAKQTSSCSNPAATGISQPQAGMLSPATAARIQAHAGLTRELCNRAEALLLSVPQRTKQQHGTPLHPSTESTATTRPPPNEQAVASPGDESATSTGLGLAPAFDDADGKTVGSAQGGGSVDASQNVWQATQYAQLVWGLGSLGYRPPASLINLLLRRVENKLEFFQPPQLWGLLWGLARLSTGPECPAPSSRWMSRFLGATERVMGEFDAQGLVHLVWSVALLRPHPPPTKQWLRSVCGAAAARLRSLTGPYLVALLEALTVLGYAPRFEISSAIMAQLRRQLHTCTPEQLATIMRALATLPSWAPPRQLLYDWVQAAGRNMRGFTPSQAANSMWAFAQLGYLPVHDVWRNLMLRVAFCGFTLASPTDLSQALWAIAHLAAGSTCRGLWVDPASTYLPQSSPAQIISSNAASTSNLAPTPSSSLGSALAISDVVGSSQLRPDQTHRAGVSTPSLSGMADQVLWLDGWMEAAARCVHRCSAPDVANMVWAAGQIGLRPSSALVDSWLQRALMLLPEMTTKEISQCIAGLALLQYRPPDAWLLAVTQHVEPRLPECAGPDLGLLLWGLASLGSPLSEPWLKVTAREAARSWPNHTGDGLGLLAWGLAQYAYSPYGEPPPEDAAVALARGQDPWARQDTRREAEWWAGFYAACGEQWLSMSPRVLVLMLLGVAGLVRTPPPRSWQLDVLRAIRLSVPKPEQSSHVLPALLTVAGLHQPRELTIQTGPLLTVARFQRSAAAATMSAMAGWDDLQGVQTEGQGDTELQGEDAQLIALVDISEEEDEQSETGVAQVDSFASQSDASNADATASGEALAALAAAKQAVQGWRQTRTPVPTLLEAMEAQGLLAEQPSLQHLLPPAALHSEWLAVLLGQLRLRWGFKRVHRSEQ